MIILLSIMFTFLTTLIVGLLVSVPVHGVNYQNCKRSFSLAILLDSSVSIPDADRVYSPLQTWNNLIKFTQSIITSLATASNISVAVIRFSSSAIVSVPLTPIPPAGINLGALNTLTYIGGNTNIATALQLANQTLQSKDTLPGSIKLALVLTDGLANIDADQTHVQASSLRNSSVEVYVIALTDYGDEMVTASMASAPLDKHLIKASSMIQLLAMNDLIVSRMCNLPDPTDPTRTTTSPPTNCLPHCLTCTNGNSCNECAHGYYWVNSTRACTVCSYRADLAFLVDTSGSIRDKNPPGGSYDNFNIILTFIINILDRLPLGFNDTRVAEITFSGTASVYFGLNTYYNASRSTLNQAILDSPYAGSFTNTSGALRLLRTDVFTPENGDRPDARNVAIVITDGLSNKDQDQTLPEAVLAHAAGITIYSVGVTNQINLPELNGIASSMNAVFTAPNFVSLTSLYEALGNTLCSG